MAVVLFPDRACDGALRRIAAGDSEALTVIYDVLGKQIYSVAYSVVRNGADAEDVMQETFLKILSGASSYRQGTNARAWVLAVARNTAFTLCRKNSHCAPDAELPEIPDESMSRAQSRIELDEALGGLPEDERTVVQLILEADMTHRQTAEIMGVSLSTVHRKYASAIEKLKEYYERGQTIEKKQI